MNFNRQQTAPIRTPRTRRNHNLAVMTSLPAGKCVPVAAIPLLREDEMRAGITVTVEMQETAELLANKAHMRVTAYFVPNLADPRFQKSRDQHDRSYMKQPQIDGGAVVPYIFKHAFGAHGSNEVYKALGLHAKPTDEVNAAYLRAYNMIWNFRASNRSRHLTERDIMATTLAPAFWQRGRFDHIVPDFDQDIIDGEVALNVVSQRLEIKGVGKVNGLFANSSTSVRESDGSHVVYPQAAIVSDSSVDRSFAIRAKTIGGANYPDIYAELAENGITVSLANIAVARKAQWFAKLRQKFEGHDDEWIIDMLMSGLTISEQHLTQPILIGDVTEEFRQIKRNATDGGNLTESAVSGGAAVYLDLNVPKVAVGGVVIVQVECYPNQMFERQADPYFRFLDQAKWPDYLRDEMDPEKVDIIPNWMIDSDHASPNVTFGFGPLAWCWNAWGPRAGGKFYRPTSNTSVDVERRRFWAIENVNPALTEDFYIVTDMHVKPFLDQESDPFEATVQGNAVITGNTVFGKTLIEATNNYEKVMEKVPMDRIEKGE